MGRPEKTITTGVRELADLAEHLRRLRGAAGKTYPELERSGGYSASVFSRAASGDALPTWQVTRAYGAACGADEPTLRLTWERARDALDRQRSVAADPGGVTTAPTGPADFNLRLRDLIRQRGTQRSVAGRAGYSPSTVSAALNAARVPTAEFVDRVLESLDLAAAERDRWLGWRDALATTDPSPARVGAALPRQPAPVRPIVVAGPSGTRALAGALLPIVLAALAVGALYTLLPVVVDLWASTC